MVALEQRSDPSLVREDVDFRGALFTERQVCLTKATLCWPLLSEGFKWQDQDVFDSGLIFGQFIYAPEGELVEALGASGYESVYRELGQFVAERLTLPTAKAGGFSVR